MGVGQVLSNRTELKIPYTPSSRWYMMVLGAEPASSVGDGGGRRSRTISKVSGVGVGSWHDGGLCEDDGLLKQKGCPFLNYGLAPASICDMKFTATLETLTHPCS